MVRGSGGRHGGVWRAGAYLGGVEQATAWLFLRRSLSFCFCPKPGLLEKKGEAAGSGTEGDLTSKATVVAAVC